MSAFIVFFISSFIFFSYIFVLLPKKPHEVQCEIQNLDAKKLYSISDLDLMKKTLPFSERMIVMQEINNDKKKWVRMQCDNNVSCAKDCMKREGKSLSFSDCELLKTIITNKWVGKPEIGYRRMRNDWFSLRNGRKDQ